nr:type II toxin-antitoxin system VapC family toxin [Kineosphaera limosa]
MLDTHTLLFALAEPTRLGPDAHAVIKDASTELVVSAATAWEIATKHRLGRLGQAAGLIAAYDRHLRRLGARELPVTSDHALLAGGLEWDHRDPFDRMIAAVAMLEGCTVVTADRALRTLDGIATCW